MAITITQSISGSIYPCYNDSYIKFTSGLTNPIYSEISVPEYTNPFKVYPDLNNEFLFNFKDIIKAKFNANGFTDANSNITTNGQSITGSYNTQDFTITSYTTSSNEVISGSYEFFKAVKQVGESTFNNEAQVLAYSENGIDYYITYFEGFPFTIDLQRINSASTVNITNLNTNVTGSNLTASSTNSFRLNIDEATENWTSTDYLPLLDILNRLEVRVDDVFKTNINLKKVVGIQDCGGGIYVKWFNNQGSYSYWLFDEYYKTEIRPSKTYEVTNNSFTNVGSLVNPITNGGYDAEERLVVKSRFDSNEANTLRDLFSSPSVQIWSKRQPWQSGEWIDVMINGSFSSNTKKKLNDIQAIIKLPQLITPKL